MKPSIGLASLNTALVGPLTWDLAGTFWDEGLKWDSDIATNIPLVPSVGVEPFKPTVGVV